MRGRTARPASASRASSKGEQRATAAHGGGLQHGEPPRGGPDAAAPALRLPDPQAALRPLHAGDRRRDLRRAARAVPRGRRGARARTPAASARAAFCYAVGWTQHTRRRPVHPHRGDPPAAARQHRPAGRRDHGAARPRVDPGLDRHPDALQHPARLPADAARRARRTFDDYIERERVADGLLGQLRRVLRQPAEGVVRRRTRRRTTTAASTTCRGSTATTPPTRRRSADARRQGEGLHRGRREPGRRLGEREGCTGWRWRSSTGSSCATWSRSRRASFWHDGPEIESGELRTEEIGDRGLPPAGGRAHREGRLVHQHAAAAAVALTRRSSRRGLPLRLWFYYHLGRRSSEKLAGSTERATGRSRRCTGTTRRTAQIDEPTPRRCCAEINGYDRRRAAPRRYTELKDDGSTSCGCWIYCGVFADGVNQAAAQEPHWEQSWVAPSGAGRGPRTGASSTTAPRPIPSGKPWSERKRYVWWDAEQEKWTGQDVPDFEETKPPDYVPPDGREGRGRDRAATTRS